MEIQSNKTKLNRGRVHLMHLGRRYKFKDYLIWMRWETFYIFCWSLLVTALIDLSHLRFVSIPAPLLTILGLAVAIVLAFKNGQCHARINEALAFSSQLNTNSMILANKLISTLGNLDAATSGPLLKKMFYRHFAWLTALRFFLRERRTWENTFEPGNKKFLEALPTPESQSDLKDELKTYFPEAEYRNVLSHRGDKEAFILQMQYRSLGELRNKELVGDNIYVMLESALDELFRLQGSLKRLKNYPYARNYYSIAVLVLKAFVAILPFGLFQFAQDLGKSSGLGFWTAWLNVPFCVLIGWIFVTLEKVGENSSNPFEGGPNDAPISAISRRIEIAMRGMLGEEIDLKPIEPKYDILF
jgi:putative membrane protein